MEANDDIIEIVPGVAPTHPKPVSNVDEQLFLLSMIQQMKIGQDDSKRSMEAQNLSL